MERTKRGVTLLEMLVIVILAAIVIVIAMPTLLEKTAHEQLREAAEALYGETQVARITAIAKNADLSMVFNTDTNWCYGLTTDTTCDCSSSSTDPCTLGKVSSTDFSGTSTLSISGFSTGNKAIFDSARGTVETVGSATFTNSTGESVTVSIKKQGIPEICSTDVGGYSAC